MEKIGKFESISTIKSLGLLTSVVFLFSIFYNILNILLGSGSVFSLILPIIFLFIGFYMFINPIKKVFFIYLCMFAIYFLIDIGLIFMISGYEYLGQIVFEAIWLVYFVYRFIKIREYKTEKKDIIEYNESLKAFNDNELFYFTVTSLTGTRRWICTNYGNYILVRYRYKFVKKLLDRKKFSFDFDNVDSKILIGYVCYNNKRNMCKISKKEYEIYKKII